MRRAPGLPAIGMKLVIGHDVRERLSGSMFYKEKGEFLVVILEKTLKKETKEKEGKIGRERIMQEQPSADDG